MIKIERMKKYLVNNFVFGLEGSSIYFNEEYLCDINTGHYFYASKISTVEKITKTLYGSSMNFPYYVCGDDTEINYSLLYQLGAFISPNKREELKLPPNYYRVDTGFVKEGYLGNNDGSYAFWTRYRPLKNGKVEVSYGTSADFYYNEATGSFNKPNNGEVDEYSIIEFTDIPKEAYPYYG